MSEIEDLTCFIEFIKPVEEKRLNARLVKHFITFFATSLMNSKITRARVLDSKSHHINKALIMICHAIYIYLWN